MNPRNRFGRREGEPDDTAKIAFSANPSLISSMGPRPLIPDPPPLSGRSQELAHLRDLLDRAASGSGHAVFVRGEGGVGKTRLVEALCEDAHRRNWCVAAGACYPVGGGAPFGVFQDAMVPMLRSLEPGALTVLTRGAEAELAALFPALGGPASTPTHGGSPSEQKMRLFWNLAELLRGLAGRQPLILALEDLQWADESSLELLHFLLRNLPDAAILVLGTYNDQYRAESPGLVATEQSLERLGLIEIIRLHPLSPDDLTDLTVAIFGVDRSLVGEFTATLHEWTGGNSFFAIETIRALVESGQIARTEGTWVGFDTRDMRLPQSIRESVMARMSALSDPAAGVVRVATVLGTRVPYDVLRAAAGLTEADLLEGIDTLRKRRIVVERQEGDSLYVDFSHPLVRETLHRELGRARARALHGQVAVALETYYGDDADDHADELAYHYANSDDGRATVKIVSYLVTAGRRAFRRYAHRGSVDQLEAAVARLDALDPGERSELETLLGPVREDLAWALHAVGRVHEGVAGMESLLENTGDPSRRLLLLYRLARAQYWAGRHRKALDHVEEALDQHGGAMDPVRAAPLLLLRGHCLEQLGRPDDARTAFETVLESAVAVGDAGLEARAHQAHALLSLWVGRMDDVPFHAERGLALAREAGASTVEFWCLWVAAATEGLTGHPQAMLELESQAREVATRIRAPHLQAWAAELRVEHASATGSWENGITIGEQAVALAESLGQQSLLARLRVWTGLIHLQRGDFERAGELLDAAWEAAVAGVPEDEIDVHSYVPAHTGRAALHIANGEFDRAVEVAERALDLAERSGYYIWAVHRLLPTLAEAHVLRGDLEGAASAGERLRKYAQRAGHQLGLAWADACDALIEWLSGDAEAAVDRLRSAATALEAVPFIWDAARIRRQFAGRLAEMGLAEEATAELRKVHEVFSRLGAAAELDKTRGMLREVGARPPARSVSEGAGIGALTPKEVEIARLVAEHKSNKAIARVLGRSPRTVSTHVSNILKKVDARNRAELADLVRKNLLPE